jgi:hypothetical protein
MLSVRQVEILQALVNRIIPADDYPGGWEAGVGDYLFRQFERDLKRLLSLYIVGLQALDAEAHALHQQPFDRLPAPAQDELLARIELGKVATHWAIDPTLFFRLAVEHCAEGYYSDPGNGGNKNGVSWEMIGFEVRE